MFASSQFSLGKICHVIVVIILALITSCTRESEISIKTLYEYPVNKAIQEVEHVQTDQWVNLAQMYISSKVAKETQNAEATKMLQYLGKRGELEKNPFALNTYHRRKSLHYIQTGNYDSSLYHAKFAAKFLNLHDSIEPGHTYHNIGLAYHFLNEPDSAIKYWQIGYELAELNKNDRLIAVFAGNLGTNFYNSGNNRTARILFRRAAEASANLGQKNAVIINNIISTMIDDEQMEQALKYWEENKELLKFDENTYEGQLFIINRALLLSKANLYDQSDDILGRLNHDKVFPPLKPEYTRILLESKLRKSAFHFLLDTNTVQVFKSNIPRFAYSLKSSLIAHKNEPEVRQVIKWIRSYYQSDAFQNAKYKQQAAIHHILAAFFEGSNTNESVFHYRKGMGLASQAEQTQIKLNNKIFEELNRLELISQKVRDTENQVKEESLVNRVLYATITLLTIIFILLYRVLQNNLKLKSAQQKQLLTEQQSLKKEQDLNRRIVEYSKIIIERNQILRHELQKAVLDAPKNVKIKIYEILKTINDTSLNEKENPNIANQIIKEEKQELETIYPGFNTLNTTEQRVLALSHENYRPKDIADLLGVSTQYVRNVKSRTKVKLETTNSGN